MTDGEAPTGASDWLSHLHALPVAGRLTTTEFNDGDVLFGEGG